MKAYKVIDKYFPRYRKLSIRCILNFSLNILINYILIKGKESMLKKTYKLTRWKNLIFSQEIITVRMFRIRRIDNSILHCVIRLQLLLLCFPEVVSMNDFFNNQINIFCCKRLKYIFFLHR